MKLYRFLAAVLFVLSCQYVYAGDVFKTDILIIGSGGAGMSAAVAAAENGAKSIIVIEKLPAIGGSTNYSGGVINSPDPKRQKKLNIKDSPKLFEKDVLSSGDNVSDPLLVRALASNATDTLYWLEEMGLKVNDRLFSKGAGNSAVRSHDTSPTGTGRDYISVLKKAADKYGVEIKTETKAYELVREKKPNGRVVQVKAVNADGAQEIYEAKAIIIATGGFASNVEMRQRYDKRLDADFFTTNNPKGTATVGNTGDGIIMGKNVGAGVRDMRYIQLLGLSGGQVVNEVGADIFLTSEGKRFVDEGGRRDVVTNAYLSLPDKKYWVVTDAKSKKNATFEEKLKNGTVMQANSVEEMAAAMNVDAKVLQDTLDRYNSFVKNKKDTDFGKTAFSQTIDTAPYVFGLQTQNVHYTMGGLMITPRAQVLDTRGKTISGLYAAGEVTGGVHGTNRVGGNAVLDIVVFGRIAGKSAAEDVKKLK